MKRLTKDLWTPGCHPEERSNLCSALATCSLLVTGCCFWLSLSVDATYPSSLCNCYVLCYPPCAMLLQIERDTQLGGPYIINYIYIKSVWPVEDKFISKTHSFSSSFTLGLGQSHLFFFFF